MNYYQASRTIWMSNNARRIEVKSLPSTYRLLGRKWMKMIAIEDSISDHFKLYPMSTRGEL